MVRCGMLLGAVLFCAAAIADGHGNGAELFEIRHGEQAQGDEDLGGPKLAGQHAWYLKLQLRNFRAEIRGMHDEDENGQVMQPMAAELSDADIEAVIAYIGTLPNHLADAGGDD